MKFLANENFPLASIIKLREAGIDTESVSELMRSAPDTKVLKYAMTNGQIILTFDKDYGELIFHRKMGIPEALIFFRFDPAFPLEPYELLFKLINEDKNIEGWFIVLDRDMVRKRKLPE